MASKKRRKIQTKDENPYDPKKLAKLGIFEDDDKGSKDDDESWRDYG